MQDSEDPIIYFSLIDFLIQLIFFTLFLFVVSVSRNTDQLPTSLGWVKDPIYWPKLNDLSPFIKESQQEQIKELAKKFKDKKLLEEFLNFLKHNPDPLGSLQWIKDKPTDVTKKFVDVCISHPDACKRLSEMNEDQLKKFTGLSIYKANCLNGKDVFIVNAYDDRLEVSSIGDESELVKIGMPLKVNQVILKSEVRKTFSRLSGKECAYRIGYIKKGDSEDMRHLAEGEREVRLDIKRD